MINSARSARRLASLVLALLAVAPPIRALAQTPAAIEADPLPHADVTLPFKLYRGIILVEVQINGSTVPAMLDTGSPVTAIDQAYLDQRSIAVTRSNLVANGQAVGVPSGLELSFGGQVIPGAIATDLSALRTAVSAPIVLGAPGLFDNRVVEIDYQTKTIVLHRRSTFRPPAGAQEIAVEAQGGADRHYGVQITVGGQTLKAILDTGANYPLLLSGGAAIRAGLGDRDVRSQSTAGINRSQTVGVTSGGFSLGPLAFKNLPLVVTPGTILAGWDANLGNNALSHLHIWLDVTGGKMWVIRPPRYDIGIIDADGGIIAVADGSPAAQAGLKPGDNIVRINGAPHLDYWNDRDWSSKAPLTLTLADGREVKVTPENLYP